MVYKCFFVMTGKSPVTTGTLYECCKAAERKGWGGDVVREGRLVAFYCGCRKMIVPTTNAKAYEVAEIHAEFGVAPELK